MLALAADALGAHLERGGHVVEARGTQLDRAHAGEQAAPEGAGGAVNRMPCRPGSTIYKGKYVDQTLDTDIGPVKARVWDRGIALDEIAGFWWRAGECAVMPVEAG